MSDLRASAWTGAEQIDKVSFLRPNKYQIPGLGKETTKLEGLKNERDAAAVAALLAAKTAELNIVVTFFVLFLLDAQVASCCHRCNHGFLSHAWYKKR